MGEALVTQNLIAAHEKSLVKVGPISHIGIVVNDVDEAARFYGETFGVGPFEVVDFDGEHTDYFLSYGEPAKPKMKAALYYEGDFFIELVQVTEGESVHTEFFGKHGEGLQHLCFLVEETDAVLKQLESKGIKPVLDYRFTMGSGAERTTIREVYLNTFDFPGGTTVQLLERTPA
jgi:catechol 2,3-dioxygenase-like lactoylglutathione lyase family enzyme